MSDTLRVTNISFGNVASNFNQAQMGFTSVGLGSTSNYAFHQFFGTTNTLCWTANGTVGIGLTNPAATLDVNGTVSTNGTLTLNNSTFVKNGTTSGYNFTVEGGNTTNSPFINFYSNSTRRCYIGNATSTTMEILCQNGARLDFGTESTNRMTITTAGNVGIGLTNPVGLLSILLNGSGIYGPSTWSSSYVLFGPGANSTTGSNVGITYNTAGNYGALISLTAAVAWRNMYYAANDHYFYVGGLLAGYVNAGGFVSVSDEREKINIKNINTERSLQRILSCTPKTFQRNMDRDNPMIPDEVKNKWHIGLNAQEVFSINPHCISEWTNQDGAARYSINYTDFVTHLIGSVQELSKKITSQDELIQAQEAKMATLQTRMDALEALVATSS